MTDELVLIERDKSVLRVTFNRPEQLNGGNIAMFTAAAQAIETAGADQQIRAILLTGAGRAFCAGADLGDSSLNKAGLGALLDAANRLTLAIFDVPKPVVVAMNGPAVGVGCSFVLAADLSIADAKSSFNFSFTKVGLMPDGGATALISLALGRTRANRVMLRSERIPAAQGVELGLITFVAAQGQFSELVESTLLELASGPTLAFAEAKKAMNGAVRTQLCTAMALEHAGQSRLVSSVDVSEGIGAFFEKREPRFLGL